MRVTFLAFYNELTYLEVRHFVNCLVSGQVELLNVQINFLDGVIELHNVEQLVTLLWNIIMMKSV